MLIRTARRGLQCGLGIVEMMVGLAVGLFVVAGGLMLFSGFVESDRRLIVDTRLMQDLRAASDMISRDVRRSGYWGAADSTVWTSGASTTPRNPYTVIRAAACAASATAAASQPADATAACTWLDRNSNSTLEANEAYGYEVESGVLYAVVGGEDRVALTDPKVVRITDLSFRWNSTAIDASDFCRTAPASNRPTVVVREVEVILRGVPPETTDITNTAVARELRTNVRLRNDYVSGNCPI